MKVKELLKLVNSKDIFYICINSSEYPKDVRGCDFNLLDYEESKLSDEQKRYLELEVTKFSTENLGGTLDIEVDMSSYLEDFKLFEETEKELKFQCLEKFNSNVLYLFICLMLFAELMGLGVLGLLVGKFFIWFFNFLF